MYGVNSLLCLVNFDVESGVARKGGDIIVHSMYYDISAISSIPWRSAFERPHVLPGFFPPIAISTTVPESRAAVSDPVRVCGSRVKHTTQAV